MTIPYYWLYTLLEFLVAAVAWFLGLGIGLGSLYCLAAWEIPIPTPLRVSLAILLILGSPIGVLFAAIALFRRLPARCCKCGGNAWIIPTHERTVWQCEKCSHVEWSHWEHRRGGGVK